MDGDLVWLSAAPSSNIRWDQVRGQSRVNQWRMAKHSIPTKWRRHSNTCTSTVVCAEIQVCCTVLVLVLLYLQVTSTSLCFCPLSVRRTFDMRPGQSRLSESGAQHTRNSTSTGTCTVLVPPKSRRSSTCTCTCTCTGTSTAVYAELQVLYLYVVGVRFVPLYLYQVVRLSAVRSSNVRWDQVSAASVRAKDIVLGVICWRYRNSAFLSFTKVWLEKI